MRCGVCLANFGPFGDPLAVVELAVEAEDAGWDGFFLWDHIHMDVRDVGPMIDSYTALGAVATATSKVRIGTLVTPLARRRPWKVARETVTLDHLSAGRLILGVGLGTPAREEFGSFGEPEDERERAEALDEGLEVLKGLWSEDRLSYRGRRYQLDEVCFEPGPAQGGQIPIWGAGWWPNKRPFRRAAKLAGVAPELRGGGTPSPAQVEEIKSYVALYRDDDSPFDLVVNGVADSGEELAALADAGATWWVERFDPARYDLTVARERIRRGPLTGDFR